MVLQLGLNRYLKVGSAFLVSEVQFNSFLEAITQLVQRYTPSSKSSY